MKDRLETILEEMGLKLSSETIEEIREFMNKHPQSDIEAVLKLILGAK